MDMNEICEAILLIQEEDELLTLNNVLITRLKSIRSERASLLRMYLHVGDTVTWDTRRSGYGECTGKVMKINRTKARVRDENNGVTWTVPINMLRKV